MIASDDLEALDQLETMLTTVAGRSSWFRPRIRGVLSEIFQSAVSGRSAVRDFRRRLGGKDKGIIGDLASNALGDVGGGLMGDLLLGGGGGGGGGFASGAVDIVPDAGSTPLIVHAKANRPRYDRAVASSSRPAERAREVSKPKPSRGRSPSTTPRPAKSHKSCSRCTRIGWSGGGGAMSPQDMMKMIRGGNNPDQQVQKMSIAIDTRNNMLIVRAPDALFEEVKQLVTDLDHTVGDSPQTTQVVSLKHTNSAAVQRALTSILNNVKVSTTGASGSQ